MFEDLLYAVNGVHCVFQLRSVLEMSELQLKACLAFLHEIGVVSFIDMFDICNIYVLENFEALWDESLLTELLDYCRIRVISHPNPHFILKTDAFANDSVDT